MPTLHQAMAAILAVMAAASASAQDVPAGSAAAAIPDGRYVSAFHDYRPVPDEASQPDKLWRAANEEVRMLQGHAGHLADNPATSSGNAAAPDKPGASIHHGHGGSAQ